MCAKQDASRGSSLLTATSSLLRLLPAPPQIATLETGVLNIKSVLTRNTDPGLIAMTGVINLLVRLLAALNCLRLLPVGEDLAGCTHCCSAALS